MTLSTAERRTIVSLSAPSTPRLRLGRTGSGGTLLDGGWWPRSTDPVAELPGLILAIDELHRPVTRLLLNARDWDSHPRRLGVAGRVVRLSFFTSHPASLLTALRGMGGGDRVDLLVIPPETAAEIADAAMTLAATPGNQVHAQHILDTVRRGDMPPEETWEDEGGSLVEPLRTIRSM